MTPLDWDALRSRKIMARVYRGQLASALMKTIRLVRPGDALYWVSVLFLGGAGSYYLGRRVFRSGGEDNVDVEVMDHAEQLLRVDPDLSVLRWATYRVTLGTKWYELQDGRHYVAARTLARRLAARRPQESLARFAAALEHRRADDAYLQLHGAIILGCPLEPYYEAAAAAGAHFTEPQSTQRLAALVRRHGSWLEGLEDRHYLRQLIWVITNGPFCLVGRSPDVQEFQDLVAGVERRLKEPLEPIPSWVCDGIHVAGVDPRFAGDDEGCLNMVEMFERDGVLDPLRPGVRRQAGVRARRGGELFT